MKRKPIKKTEVKKVEVRIPEVMLDEKFDHKNFTYDVVVYDDGKVVVKVIKHVPIPNSIMGELDYPSLEVLSKRAKENSTLANRFIGDDVDDLIEKIENKLYE